MLTSGTILQDRYQLKQHLNAHPARQTWLAEDLETGERVVVKMLALTGAIQWDDLKLFEREAQILQHIEYPQIPKCRDYFSLDESNLWFVLVQDYIPGVSLKEQLNKGKRFKQEEIEKIALNVLEILQFLHQLNPPVLHRDIKPSNLIWGEDEQIYLIDFGAVQSQPNVAGKTFTVVGTYGYTPIEQFGGQAVPASDLYALGATLIHLLTGISPGELQDEDLRLQFRDRLTNKIAPKLINWLEKLTEPAVKKRFASVQEALSAWQLQPQFLIPWQQELAPSVKLEKSPEKLIIEIPSSWQIFGNRSWHFWLPAKIEVLKSIIPALQSSLQSLPQSQQQIILAAGTMGVLLLAISLLRLLIFIISLLIGIFFFSLSLLLFFLPATVIVSLMLVGGAIALQDLLNSHVNYFATTSLIFRRDKFSLTTNFFGNYHRKLGKTGQIKAIYPSLVSGLAKKQHPVIAISTQVPTELGDWDSNCKTYTFGHQLTEPESEWLVQEITDWLRELKIERGNQKTNEKPSNRTENH